MVIADVLKWWDQHGNKDKKAKINEIINQIKNDRFRTRNTIGSTSYLGGASTGRKDTLWIYKSGMALSTYITICRLPFMSHGVLFMAARENESASYNVKNMAFVTSTTGYGIQQIGVGAQTTPWNAGSTTYRIIDSGGVYLLQVTHTKYYGSSINFLISGYAQYEN